MRCNVMQWLEEVGLIQAASYKWQRLAKARPIPCGDLRNYRRLTYVCCMYVHIYIHTHTYITPMDGQEQ